jgi:hypothetical protein
VRHEPHEPRDSFEHPLGIGRAQVAVVAGPDDLGLERPELLEGGTEAVLRQGGVDPGQDHPEPWHLVRRRGRLVGGAAASEGEAHRDEDRGGPPVRACSSSRAAHG